MKKYKIGKVDYSDLKIPPEKHERDTAFYFANRGLDVKFIKPSSIKGANSPDFVMSNKSWETKSPLLYKKSSFEYNLKKAIKQSENIIYDLRRINWSDEKKYIGALTNKSKTRRIKTLLVITKDGRLLTIKGRFDKI